MIPYLLGGAAAALGWLLMQSDADFKRGQALLAKNPDDPTGNLVVGAYLGGQGKWDEALPYLAKSGNKDVVDAVTKDQAGAPGGKYDQLEVGDLWATAAAKVAKYKKQFNDHAMTWYVQCWPSLDEPFKGKLRARVKQIQSKGGAATAITKLTAWPQAAGKTFSSGQYAVTGSKSLRIDPDPKIDYGYLTTGDLTCPAGKDYVFSGWALSDGTDTAQDHIKMDVFQQGVKLIDQVKLALPQDTPMWVYFTYKGTFPQNAILFKISCVLASKQGSLWFDDVSVKVDGKELLKNTSFD